MKRTLTIITALTMALAAGAWAQESPPPKPEQPEKPTQPVTPPTSDPLPSLDDLLGLPRDRESGLRPPAEDTAKAELERQLSPAEAAEQFRQAVDLMGQTAKRLGDSRDTGLQTQRIQEDIVRKLETLIRSAEQQQSRRSRSSSSRSQSQSQDQPNQPGQPQESQQASRGDNRSENVPPARQEGPLNPELAQRGAAWGSLPQRLRDALVQGNTETYSAMYKRLTDAYYRKLAEERP